MNGNICGIVKVPKFNLNISHFSAQIFVFELCDNGKITHQQRSQIVVIGNAANRLGSQQLKLEVDSVLFQYRREFLYHQGRWVNPDKPTTNESRQLNEEFKRINTEGQDKYAGVIKPLAKIMDDALWDVVESIFEDTDEGKVSKSTAAFNGMHAKWTSPKGLKFKIPVEVKSAVLLCYKNKEITTTKMKDEWNYEFQKACFLFFTLFFV